MPAAAIPGLARPVSAPGPRASADRGCRSLGSPLGGPSNFPCLAPVDREQHRAKHGAVVSVELTADRGDELPGRARRVLVAPGRHGGARPVQVAWLVLAVPHGVPSRKSLLPE